MPSRRFPPPWSVESHAKRRRIGGVDPLSPAKGEHLRRRYILPRGIQSATAHTIKTIKTPIAT